MYIDIYQEELEGGRKIATSASIFAKSNETQKLEALNKRVRKSTASITLKKDSIVFNSGPKELKFKLDFNSEIEAIENLLKENFQMSSVLSDDKHKLDITFSF